MKYFLDYISEITTKEPVRLNQYEKSMDVYIGKIHIKCLWRYNNYAISIEGNRQDKLIGGIYSIFSFQTIIYIKLMRYRFL